MEELITVEVEQETKLETAYELGGGIIPTGTKQVNITSNGTTTEDVTNYADAEIIVSVPTGITPTGTKQISITSNGTTTEDVTNYADAEITVNVSGSSVDLLDRSYPTGDYTTTQTTANALCLAYRGTIDTLYAPNLTSIKSEGFRYATFQYISAPNANIGSYANHVFRDNSRLKLVALPSATNSVYAYSFYNCTALETVDIWGFLQTEVFRNCTSLTTLILRSTSMIALSNINNFTNSPFASGKSGGTLYVPSALISSYQSATNWLTILGYENNSIAAIEGSIYETQYADGTPV